MCWASPGQCAVAGLEPCGCLLGRGLSERKHHRPSLVASLWAVAEGLVEQDRQRPEPSPADRAPVGHRQAGVPQGVMTQLWGPLSPRPLD